MRLQVPRVREWGCSHHEVDTPVICEWCHFVKYCSTKCRSKAWHRYHKHLCYVLPFKGRLIDLCNITVENKLGGNLSVGISMKKEVLRLVPFEAQICILCEGIISDDCRYHSFQQMKKGITLSYELCQQCTGNGNICLNSYKTWPICVRERMVLKDNLFCFFSSNYLPHDVLLVIWECYVCHETHEIIKSTTCTIT